MKKIQHPFRDTFLTRHHIINKKNSGKTKPDNILMLWRDKHTAFHDLFKNSSLREIIQNWNRYQLSTTRWQWKLVFHNLTFEEAKKLLQRVWKIKRHQHKRRFNQALPL